MNINMDANQVEETLDLSLREREKKKPFASNYRAVSKST